MSLFVDEFAAQAGIPEKTIQADLEQWRNLLLASREKRVKPLRDEMVLTSWNGLMIVALAKGYAATGKRGYIDAAEKGMDFIKQRLMTPQGRLLRSFYAGESATPGFLEDYTFFVWGLIEMYEATLEERYLSDAITLSKETLRLFADEFSYGLFDSGSDAENVLIRKKSAADGVIPSGNSVAAMNFLRLGKITSKQKYIKEGEGILRSMMGDLLAQPTGYLHAVAALDCLRGPDIEITLVGRQDDPETQEMLRSVGGRFIPGLVLRFRSAESDETDYKTLEGRTTAYVCSQGSCRPPVTGREALEKLLGELVG